MADGALALLNLSSSTQGLLRQDPRLPLCSDAPSDDTSTMESKLEVDHLLRRRIGAPAWHMEPLDELCLIPPTLPRDEPCLISSMAPHDALCRIPDNAPLLLMDAVWLSGRARAAGER